MRPAVGPEPTGAPSKRCRSAGGSRTAFPPDTRPVPSHRGRRPRAVLAL